MSHLFSRTRLPHLIRVRLHCDPVPGPLRGRTSAPVSRRAHAPIPHSLRRDAAPPGRGARTCLPGRGVLLTEHAVEEVDVVIVVCSLSLATTAVLGVIWASAFQNAFSCQCPKAGGGCSSSGPVDSILSNQTQDYRI